MFALLLNKLIDKVFTSEKVDSGPHFRRKEWLNLQES
jgi:hypothetical protein